MLLPRRHRSDRTGAFSTLYVVTPCIAMHAYGRQGGMINSPLNFFRVLALTLIAKGEWPHTTIIECDSTTPLG